MTPRLLRSIFCVALLFTVALAGCEFGSQESPAQTPVAPVIPTPTSTAAVAHVPTVDSSVPSPTYLPASNEDLALISQALNTTSITRTKSFHFASTWNMTSFEESKSEGDFVAPDGYYAKSTQGESIEEMLFLGNVAYCRDASGKWIVSEPDIKSVQTKTMATAMAKMHEELQDSVPGMTATPWPTYDLPTSPFDLLTPAQQYAMAHFPYASPNAYDYYYVGEEKIDGVSVRHYLGRQNIYKMLPPEFQGTPSMIEFPKDTLDHTVDLWVDPSTGYLRKHETGFRFSSSSSSTSGSDLLISYSISKCSVPRLDNFTPTIPPLPSEGATVSTILLSRINDPSITLPTP